MAPNLRFTNPPLRNGYALAWLAGLGGLLYEIAYGQGTHRLAASAFGVPACVLEFALVIRSLRMSVEVHGDRLVARNLFTTRTIPIPDVKALVWTRQRINGYPVPGVISGDERVTRLGGLAPWSRYSHGRVDAKLAALAQELGVAPPTVTELAGR